MTDSTGLAEALASAGGPRTCAIRAVMTGLPPKDKAALTEALEDRPGWSTSTIITALAAIGRHATRWQVGAHRRQECSCYRATETR